MAAAGVLVVSRLAAASAFASLPSLLRPQLSCSWTPAQRAAALHGSAPRPAARVALVLSGCGVYDGTEIHEASAILVHLSRGGAEVQIFAPDIPQMHVIDHSKGQPSESETRNVLTESARIARGKIADLATLTASNHDAAIFPGGFGAAKNLSTFAVDGKDCRVNKDVERVLREFHQAGKPIGRDSHDVLAAFQMQKSFHVGASTPLVQTSRTPSLPIASPPWSEPLGHGPAWVLATLEPSETLSLWAAPPGSCTWPPSTSPHSAP
ncbi:ES1 protein homolog, mitochondrial isoform X2 [Otolemur garnettii]|uniref:ES1 protein homolog, mitochondrial isoform X2 n=1 Tax=Otolemur garnettii TaxID=30611 RepID=UPI000C7EA7A8|nr:ES1 protein homolog, mitochondrial isoform X2 [Otolemur garnettii]